MMVKIHLCNGESLRKGEFYLSNNLNRLACVPCTGSPDCDLLSISTQATEAAPTAARSLLVVSPGSAPGAFGFPPLASKSRVTLAIIRAFSSSLHDDSDEQRSRESRTYW